MKKFNFSLQKILEIKEQVLENFKIELGSLNYDFKKVEEEIKMLNMKNNDTNEELNNKLTKSLSVGEIAYYKMYMESIIKKIENKEKEKILINNKIENKRLEIVSIDQEISSLEKLKEKELEKYNYSVMKSEEIFIEEFLSHKRLRYV